MKRCAYCGRENEDGAVHCRECGTAEFQEVSGASSSGSGCRGAVSATCARCGATTDVPESFIKQQHGFPFPAETLCPICWRKHKTSPQKLLLAGSLALGILGLLFLHVLQCREFGLLLLNLFLFNSSLILSIPLHELAHAYVAKKLGWRVFLISIGFGRTVWKRVVLGFETELRAIPLVGFVATAPRDKAHYRSKLFALAIAGPMTNAVLLLGSLLLMRLTADHFGGFLSRLVFTQMFLFANLLVLIANLWPQSIAAPLGRIPSDGCRLLQALTAKGDQAAEAHASWFLAEGALCHEKGQYEHARSWFERGLYTYADNVQLLNWNATNLLALGEFRKARESYQALLPRLQTERLLRAIALNNLAYADVVLGERELLPEADFYSVEALSTLGWHPSIKGTRGAVLWAAGKVEEAIPLLREAMETHEDPRNKAQNACWLAMAQAQKGDLTTSRKLLDAATKLDPTCFLLDRTRSFCGSSSETTPPRARS